MGKVSVCGIQLEGQPSLKLFTASLLIEERKQGPIQRSVALPQSGK